MKAQPLKRRKFIKTTGSALTGLTMVPGSLPFLSQQNIPVMFSDTEQSGKSIIGGYGNWATSLLVDPPKLSYRLDQWSDINSWREQALNMARECIAAPDIGGQPKVTVTKKYVFDGLEIEELEWQLPYGRPTKAILLKPEGAKGPLPAVLGLHDHGGNKYFGRRKITRTSDNMHPMMEEHQQHYYEGFAWANEIAKRGYVVLVNDSFTFGSRRVMYGDLLDSMNPEHRSDADSEDPDNIKAYNSWAGAHEHVMSKSLFCAGTTWPGVFLTEDQRALDILISREEVDAERVGCCGLSGGGLRTCYLGGVDPRIRCAISVGFMTTWADLIVSKSYTHTWMVYAPRLPQFLDFPEILGLRAPLPTLVLNNNEDQLFTLQEMKRADQMLRQVFDNVGAGERYQANFYPGPHKFDGKMQADAFTWFDRWL